jgi:hypothetical protein
MARPRKLWRDLSAGHKRRLERYYEGEHGWTGRQVWGRYDRGTLPGLKVARGHELNEGHGGGRRGGLSMWVLVQHDDGSVSREQVDHLTTREGRLVGTHWNAVDAFLNVSSSVRYREWGEQTLSKLEGKRVNGELLATSLDALEESYLVNPDEFRFEDIYPSKSES